MTEISKLVFHYYIKDNLHEIKADTRNICENEMLNVFNVLCEIYSIDAQILSVIREEGGLKDIWKLFSENCPQIAVITAIISLFFTIYPINKEESEIDKNIRVCLDKLKIQELRKSPKFSDPKECMALDDSITTGQEALDDLNNNKKAVLARSNFFKELNANPNVEKFSASSSFNDFKEIEIYRSDFKSLVIPDPKKKIDPFEDVEIYLISPVFRNRKYKWRGLIKDEFVTFRISDRKFNKIVREKKFPFRDGDILECSLKIKGEVDYFDDWIKKEIFVTKVHAFITNGRRHSFSEKSSELITSLIKTTSKEQLDLFEADENFV